MEAQELAIACALAASDKKAEAISVLDLRGISSFTDFFVICSGTSEPHLKAITGAITETIREKYGVKAHATSGIPASQWVVIDYVDVLVHALHQDKREFYALDDLWGDAPSLDWEGMGADSKPRPKTRARAVKRAMTPKSSPAKRAKK